MLGAAGLLLAGAFYISFISTPTDVSAAQAGSNNITGYAWSSNTGWMDFSTSTYNPNGVLADGSGNITGYAWSDNIGWVKFGGLSSFPTNGPGTFSTSTKIVNGNVIGWARACAGTSNGDCSNMNSRTDGWDGWISLRGTGYGVTFDSNSKRFSGFAWGSNVVGWLDFSKVQLLETVNPDLPIVLSSNPASPITMKSATDISWTSGGASFCTTTKKMGTGAVTVFSTDTTSAGLTSGELSTTTVFTTSCINAVGYSAAGTLVIDVSPITADIVTDKPSVSYGGTANITWSSTGATSCTLKKDGNPFGTNAASNLVGISSGAIITDTTFTVFCTNANGAVSPTKTIILGVTTLPVINDVTVTSPIYSGQYSTVGFTADHSSYCKINGDDGSFKDWTNLTDGYMSGSMNSKKLTLNTKFTVVCENGVGNSTTSSKIVTVNPVPLTVMFVANPNPHPFASSTYLSWSSPEAVSCTLQQGIGAAESVAKIGDKTIAGLPNGSTKFTIVCTKGADSVSDSVSDSVTVNVEDPQIIVIDPLNPEAPKSTKHGIVALPSEIVWEVPTLDPTKPLLEENCKISATGPYGAITDLTAITGNADGYVTGSGSYFSGDLDAGVKFTLVCKQSGVAMPTADDGVISVPPAKTASCSASQNYAYNDTVWTMINESGDKITNVTWSGFDVISGVSYPFTLKTIPTKDASKIYTSIGTKNIVGRDNNSTRACQGSVIMRLKPGTNINI